MKKEVPNKEGLRQLPIRPVYLVSMEHAGKTNVITIGMFASLSGNPTLVGIGIAPKRYSYELIRDSREYVVNVVDDDLRGALRICGERSGRDVDKVKLAGLTLSRGVRVKAPLIVESPVSLECRVIREVETGDHVWFIGEVLATHVDADFDWKQGLLFKWVGEDGFFHRVGKRAGKY